MRVGSIDGSSKPTSVSRSTNSCSSSAPATQPTQSSMLRRTASGTSPRTTTSLTANRPPGLSTRNASASTLRLSPDRLITQLEMMTSTLASGSGMCSICPSRNSTLVTPASAALRRASSSMSPVMSRPYALPVGPTRRAESSTSMPPPEPRSSTISPGLSWASAVGLPHPSDASTAAEGSSSVSPLTYRFDVIGSGDPSDAAAPQQEFTGPQQEAAFPASSTRRAASPYFSPPLSVTSDMASSQSRIVD